VIIGLKGELEISDCSTILMDSVYSCSYLDKASILELLHVYMKHCCNLLQSEFTNITEKAEYNKVLIEKKTAANRWHQ
jgi:hypothetical protein